jgi:hypothetical protein
MNQYVTDMLRCMRDVNVDNNTVGWYQSTCMNSWLDPEGPSVITQFQFQESVPKSVCLVYDPVRTSSGSVYLKAYRLTDKFMAKYKHHNESNGNGFTEQDFKVSTPPMSPRTAHPAVPTHRRHKARMPSVQGGGGSWRRRCAALYVRERLVWVGADGGETRQAPMPAPLHPPSAAPPVPRLHLLLVHPPSSTRTCSTSLRPMQARAARGVTGRGADQVRLQRQGGGGGHHHRRDLRGGPDPDPQQRTGAQTPGGGWQMEEVGVKQHLSKESMENGVGGESGNVALHDGVPGCGGML